MRIQQKNISKDDAILLPSMDLHLESSSQLTAGGLCTLPQDTVCHHVPICKPQLL